MMKDENDLIILLPVYNDWESFSILLSELEKTMSNLGRQARILTVDDGSTIEFSPTILELDQFQQLNGIEILHLVINVGHQRAIAIGLSYIHEHYPTSSVVVMDADGEDRPEDVERLIVFSEKMSTKIIFAQRTERSESVWFRFFYIIYRLLFSLLTGKKISFGNFSFVPANILQKIVYIPEIWIHYAGAIIKSRIPIFEIPTIRGKRYRGQTSMNFSSLVLHGMSAISIYLDIVTVRMLLAGIGTIFVGLLGILVVIYIRFFTLLAIPGWATNLSIGIAMIIFQAILLITLLNFFVLNSRSSKHTIPVKEYKDFCDRTEIIL